jgi:hypothetical protein
MTSELMTQWRNRSCANESIYVGGAYASKFKTGKIINDDGKNI